MRRPLPSRAVGAPLAAKRPVDQSAGGPRSKEASAAAQGRARTRRERAAHEDRAPGPDGDGIAGGQVRHRPVPPETADGAADSPRGSRRPSRAATPAPSPAAAPRGTPPPPAGSGCSRARPTAAPAGGSAAPPRARGRARRRGRCRRPRSPRPAPCRPAPSTVTSRARNRSSRGKAPDATVAGVANSATSRSPVWVGGELSPQSRRVRCSITGTNTPSTRCSRGSSQFTCRSCSATAEAVLQARITSPQPAANSRCTPAQVSA